MYSRSFNRAISATTLAAVMLILMLQASSLAEETPAKADPAEGKAIFSQTCIACHGANGKGVLPGVIDLSGPDGPLSKMDEELAISIREGMARPGAPLSMPPNGGLPELTEQQIRSVIAYLRLEFGS